MSLVTSYLNKQLRGRGENPAEDAAWGTKQGRYRTGGAPNDALEQRMGFFTDTSICIGCKACEVACKEWNHNPEDGLALSGDSYDNTGALGADTWRHVAFVEQSAERIEAAKESGRKLVDLGMPSVREPFSASEVIAASGGSTTYATDAPAQLDVDVFTLASTPEGLTPTAGSTGAAQDFRWLMASDVCKHCTHAGCLDNCPTGALMRTEFGTVVVQADVCNGCGYCVGGCPFGVIARREKTERRSGRGHERSEARNPLRGDRKKHGNVDEPVVINHGNAQKCTLCYDRLREGQTPACAQTCPTTSIKFGTHEEMVKLAEERVAVLHAQGTVEARLYGANENDGVGGTGSVFLLLDDPEVYGLPPDPVAPSMHLSEAYKRMAFAAGGMAAAAVAAFVGGSL